MTIKERVINELKEYVHPADVEITDESTFEELGLDSLDYVEMSMAVEEEFDIEIPDGDYENLQTVGSFIQRVTELAA